MQSLKKISPKRNDSWHFSTSISTQLSIATLVSTALIIALINNLGAYQSFQFEGTIYTFIDSFKQLEFWIVILFPAVCVFVLSQIFLHPLNEMVKISREVSKGNLDVRFEEDSKVSEFLELSRVFNQMLVQLETAFNQQRLAYQQQGLFISNAAHELRTPLATLRSNLESLQTGPESTDEDFAQWVSRQKKSLLRLENLVEDLLLLAKEDNFEKNELVLGILLEEVIAEAHPLAEEAEVSILLKGDAEIAVLGEENLLMQVFSNLLENAIRYNKPGGYVEVSLEQTNTHALIKVSDTGIGISEKDQALIFERFYRVDQSRVHHGNGAGLGLSIVTNILKHYNGTIQVKSKPGIGTSFTISLPKS